MNRPDVAAGTQPTAVEIHEAARFHGLASVIFSCGAFLQLVWALVMADSDRAVWVMLGFGLAFAAIGRAEAARSERLYARARAVWEGR